MSEPLCHRQATHADAPLLAGMNRRMLADEGRRNPPPLPELQAAVETMLTGGYVATIFARTGHTVAYALWRDEAEWVDLRQFYVERMRRREGIGRAALGLLLDEIWPHGKRIRVSCLTDNETGLSFWRAVGFADYLITLELERTSESGATAP